MDVHEDGLPAAFLACTAFTVNTVSAIPVQMLSSKRGQCPAHDDFLQQQFNQASQ
jgi:hypothetical protein